jgi:hypothetical protein
MEEKGVICADDSGVNLKVVSNASSEAKCKLIVVEFEFPTITLKWSWARAFVVDVGMDEILQLKTQAFSNPNFSRRPQPVEGPVIILGAIRSVHKKQKLVSFLEIDHLCYTSAMNETATWESASVFYKARA